MAQQDKMALENSRKIRRIWRMDVTRGRWGRGYRNWGSDGNCVLRVISLLIRNPQII